MRAHTRAHGSAATPAPAPPATVAVPLVAADVEMSTLPVEHVAVQQGQPMMTAQPVLFQGAYGMQIPPIQSAPGGYMYGYPGSPGVQVSPLLLHGPPPCAAASQPRTASF